MPKQTYTVRRPEVHYSYVQIEAESPEEAKQLVYDGNGEETQCDYAYTLEPSEAEWDVQVSQ